ncbi:DUF2065 domain-containing protein [Abyssibacter profundi]|uniref:DUF2065 domain-containing protein n=1 Tax=Abyssibacter profundi TaxID=2182787 RepID=A0A363UNW7_9GAMM|nr:DUF2065 domain-containing protein [Abyssibacter profundi]MBV60242.1 DUF2065 domain-containing protein [Nevskiales bacterium]PWN57156.1 DUF2065 domain-containing protein [Abyssibacter profundi]
MWEDVLRALALVLIIEGMMPFLSPTRWRLLLARVAATDDRTLRTAGLIAMIAGLCLLQWMR